MAYVGYQGRSPSPSDEEDYHSADSSPTPSNHLWTHDRDIGQGGFGVVKLFIHQVCFTLQKDQTEQLPIQPSL